MPHAASVRADDTDPATEYAIAVREGAIVAGQAVRWAADRHLEDLETAHRRGWYWDPGELEHFLGFARLCHHLKGTKAGDPIVLDPWQTFAVGCAFGWRRQSDGSRRFRRLFNEVARKNGKSTVAAVVGLYGLAADGEPGPEIYAAATKREQARVVHRAAMEIRDESPELRRVISKERDVLYFRSKSNRFVPLGRDSHTEDGLNPSIVLIDELHAHQTGDMVDVLVSAFGAREQPLIMFISTAGKSIASYGYQEHCYYLSVADPNSGVDDDEAWVYIAQLDEGDDIYDESTWIKANPGLGSSVRLDVLQSAAVMARQNPRSEPNFRVKHLNQWINSDQRWLAIVDWDACGVWNQ